MSLRVGIVGALRSVLRMRADEPEGFDGERLPVSLGASLAVVAARLGADVHFVAGLPADTDHPELRAPLTAEGVALHTFELDSQSASVAELMGTDGAANSLPPVPEDLRLALAEAGECDAMLVQLELSDPALVWIGDELRASGRPWMVHAAPARELEAERLAGVDCLVLAEGAARVLARSRGDEVSCKGLLRRLAALGPRKVCLYRPVAGSQAFDGERLWEVEPEGASPGDLLGAELVFTAALSLALAAGERTQVALQRAQELALLPGSGRGPFGGLPEPERLLRGAAG
ncbi:MAG: PfkB family carbohydrate kinase [Planctomycetota bacterium]